jgi:peptidoglycan/xylan/chitin deacetylase (PgdA/CDA1 family)
MVKARFGLGLLLLLPIYGCDTAEQSGGADTAGTSGAQAGQTSGGSGGSGGSSTAGTSAGGSSTAGTSTGGSAAGTSAGGSSTGGGTTQLDASPNPPGGLSADQVPMFVTIGWDDNAYSGLPGSDGEGGMSWSTDFVRNLVNPAGSGNSRTFDGAPVRVSYYLTSTYISEWMAESPTLVKRSWRKALDDGHEIGNHTESHSHGAQFKLDEWSAEINSANEWLVKPFDPNEVDHSPDDTKGIGADPGQLYGFRTPFLEYNDATLGAVHAGDFLYDCSIEEGWHWEQDGSNYNWPYTLDNGSPGHEILVEWDTEGVKLPITPKPGLWEMPVYPLIVPPDSAASQYGVAPGLRAKIKGIISWFDTDAGKITGFDYNLWVSAQLSKAEFLATLKYSFDIRLAGNRAPFMLGAHTDYYSSKYTAPANSTAKERREAIEEFVQYVLTKPEVRVVTTKNILDWIRNPVAL